MQDHMYEADHRMFRDSFRKFVAAEITPFHAQWEKAGCVPRELWRKAGELGFLAFDVDEAYGGLGVKDYRFNAIVSEELAAALAHGPGFPIHTDMVVPYLIRLGSEEQKQRWLPGMVSGELIGAVAMTEPDAGSDVAGMKATALWDGESYILNGQKTFISNGILSDVVVVAAKTDPAAGNRGISLLVVEQGMAGFERGRNLEKVGRPAQDTAEIFFSDVRVPRANLLGQENMGFKYLMGGLVRERLTIALGAVATAERALELTILELTIPYCQERSAFGQKIGAFQNSRFRLAEMKTEIQIGRTFIDQCILQYNAGALTPEVAAMAKWWCTDMEIRVVDRCVQLFGGYGYMLEYPIAKMYLDVRAESIYGGSNEIMKEVIGRAMGF
jgi:alkylation response protein AidB-like acyl-CoA dehydrogenase